MKSSVVVAPLLRARWERSGPDSRAGLARVLAACAASGLPLEEGLRASYPEQPPSVSLSPGHHAGLAILDHLEAGEPLSSALEAAAPIMTPEDAALARAGEASGRLPEVLGAWSRMLRAQETARTSLRDVAIYPAIVLCVTWSILTVHAWKAIPTIASVGTEAGVALHPLTRMAVLLLTHSGWAFQGLAVALLVLALAWNRHLPFHSFALRVMGVVPWLGDWLRGPVRASLLHVLAAHLEAGRPPHEALRLAAAAISTGKERRELESTATRMEAGLDMAEHGHLLDARTTWDLSHALRGPDPVTACRALADAAEVAWSRQSARRLATLEPAVLVSTGVVLALVIAGMFLPVVTTARFVP